MTVRQTIVASVLDRRAMLRAGSLALAWPFCHLPVGMAADRVTRLNDYPFQLGIASGDPAPDGVVLWTRLCMDPFGDGGMPPEDILVHWQIATDDKMSDVVQKGVTTASADWAHSVHVEVHGLLPDRTYFYQFKAGNEISPVGKTRTAPAADALVDHFRFAFASCQKYEEGYYTAYDHMAQDDLHAVIHLGDYIYEGKPKEGTPRHFAGPVIKTLADYRTRHAIYRSDPLLQKVHSLFPWIVTWDDHEVENNYADANSPDPGVSTEEFLTRRANAYKAYYEHMPLRASSVPRGPFMDLYRRIEFGRLVQFSVLDTRQYRSNQPCGDGYKAPCERVFDPEATMLGAAQEQWLMSGLTESQCLWKVMAQQVIMARVDFSPPGHDMILSMDKWSGYEAARRRLMQFLYDRKIENAVTLTGDVHCNWVHDLKVDYDDLDSPTVGTEFVGTSITSRGDGNETRKGREGVLEKNPAAKFFNDERGYVRCEVTTSEWRTDFRTVPFVSRPEAPCVTRASFVLESGEAGAKQA
jgi:alkaline phosphatase D